MLQITARLFKYNQLTGYRISDGQQEQDFNKMQTWMFAKQNQLLNVKAIGSGDNGDFGLSGTNGFELKSLPQIKLDEPRVQEIPQSQPQDIKYDTQDLQAALMYHMTLESSVQSIKDYTLKLVEFVKIGQIQDTTERKQKSMEYMKDLFNKRLEEPDFIKRRRSLTSQLIVTHKIMIADKLVGYTIKNASISQIIFVRSPLSNYMTAQAEYLAPWESVDISRVEMLKTLSLPEYSGRFQNGKIVTAPPTNYGTVVDWVMRGYITCSNKIPAKQMEVNENSVKYIANNKTMKEIMKKSESDAKYLNDLALQYKEELDGEFGDNLLRTADDLVRQTKETQKEVRQKLKETSSARGIFNAFKR